MSIADQPDTAPAETAATCTVLTNEHGGTRLIYDLTGAGTVQVEVTLTSDLLQSEPPTTADAVDAWSTVTSAIRAGLPAPDAVFVDTSAVGEFGRVEVQLEGRSAVDAWASWAQVPPAIRRIDYSLFSYEAVLAGWRGWRSLHLYAYLHSRDLADADREALGGGEQS